MTENERELLLWLARELYDRKASAPQRPTLDYLGELATLIDSVEKESK